MHVPGSDSSEFTTRKRGRESFAGSGMKVHFKPQGKPAPPRPRSPEALTSSVTSCGVFFHRPLRTFSRVLYPSCLRYPFRVWESFARVRSRR